MIHGNFLESHYNAIFANDTVRDSLGIPDSATFEQVVLFWNNTDNLTISGVTALTDIADMFGWLTVIDGSLTINTGSLTGLDGLSNLTRVGNSLDIVGGSLTNLDGLSSLTHIGNLIHTGSYSYSPSYSTIRCAALTNLDGLSSLTNVYGYFTISAPLTNVDGLSSLTSVSEVLEIETSNYGDEGPTLTNVDGLSSLTRVGSSLYLGNNILTNVDGLSNLTHIGGRLYLNNNLLTNLDGLSNLGGLDSILDLSNNQLTNLNGIVNISTSSSMIVTNSLDSAQLASVGYDLLGCVLNNTVNERLSDSFRSAYPFYSIQWDAAYPMGRTDCPLSDGTGGGTPTVPVDNFPDPFTFSNLSAQDISTVVESNTVTVSGFDNPINILIGGNTTAQFRVNSGTWGRTGSISQGDTLQLRVTTSDVGSTVVASVVIGGYSTTWSASTTANTSPVVILPTLDITLYVGDQVNIPLGMIFEDSESTTLTYTEAGLPGSLSIVDDAIVGTLTWNDISERTIYLTAHDEHGGSTVDEFGFIVRTPESSGPKGDKGDTGDDFNGDARLTTLESSIGTPGTPFSGGRLTGKWEGEAWAIREESEGYWVDEGNGRTHDNIWVASVVAGELDFTDVVLNPGTMASGSTGVYKYINDNLMNEVDFLKQAVLDLQAVQPRESLRVIRNDGNIYDQNTDGTWNNLKSTFAVDNNISQSKIDEMNRDGNYILQTIYLYK